MKTREDNPTVPNGARAREPESVSGRSVRKGTILVSADGSAIASDPGAEAILGVPLESMGEWLELTERWRAVHEDGSPFRREEHPARLSLRDGTPRENEIVGLRVRGDEFLWISIEARPLFRSGETTPHAVALSIAEIDGEKDPLDAIRESNAILNTIDESTSTSVLVYAKDLQGRLVKVNAATLRLLNFSEEEIAGKAENEYLANSEDAERIATNDRLVVETGQILVCEEPVETIDGEKITYLSIKMPYRDERGKIIGLVGVSADISERERVEQRLRVTNERLSTILERMTDAFITVDRDWRITYANRETARLNNVTIEEIVGKTLYEMWPWSEGSISDRYYRQAIADGNPVHFEFLYEPLDMWLEVHAYPSETGLGIFFREITERVLAQKGLRESEERFRRMAETIPDVFWISDFVRGEIHYISPAYEQIWGNPPESLEGDIDRWIETIYPDDREMVRKASERCLAEGNNTIEYRIVRPDGSLRWIRDRGFVIREEDGSVFRVAGIAEDITDRIEAEQAGRERESLLRLALTSAGAGAWSWDIRTGKVVWSEEYYTLYGLDPKYISPSYENWLNSIVPEDREATDRATREALETGAIDIQFRVLHPLGQRWFQARGQLLLDDAGRPIRMMGITQDITSAKRLEEEREAAASALRRSEARFRRLVEANIFGVAVGDFSGRMLDANDSLLHLIGYTREELEAGNIRWLDLTPPEYLDLDRRAGEELLARGVCQPFEKEYIHKDGHRIPILIGSALLDDTREGDERIISFYIDLSELKRTENALREQRSLLETILKQAADAVIVCDRQGRLTFINATARRLAGRDPEATNLDLSFTDWGTAHDATGNLVPREEYAMNKALRGEISTTIESRMVRADGSYYDILISAAPLRDSDGEIVGAVGSFMDITERVAAQTRLQQQARDLERLNATLADATNLLTNRNQELDRFVYAVSHDLKAPLRAIANLSEWIEEDIDDRLTEDTRHQMELLRARVGRMIALIDGLLEYSRIGRWEATTEPVAVGELLAETIDSLAPPPAFRIAIGPGMPTIVTKRLPLTQVFANLISNAIKHHDRPNGSIVLTARAVENGYEFAVTDDGPGIAPEHHERIFGIFQTLKGGDKSESTGIGLTIVKKILDTEGGSIVLESDVGKGTTFRFIWPARADS